MDYLAGNKRDMQKAAPDMGVVVGKCVEYAVHQVIADKSTSGIGYAGRDAGGADILHHGLDRKGRKVGRCAVRTDYLINGLIAFVIRDSGVVNIDGNPLWSQIILTAGLTDTKNSIRLFFGDRGIDRINGFAEYRGHCESDNLDIIKLFRKQFHCLQGRIDGLLVKRAECCEKDFHKTVILSADD